MITDENTMIAPTERSIPAVKITKDWASATMPTIATCCKINVSAKGEKNLPPSSNPKIAREQSKTTNGTAAGVCLSHKRTLSDNVSSSINAETSSAVGSSPRPFSSLIDTALPPNCHFGYGIILLSHGRCTHRPWQSLQRYR